MESDLFKQISSLETEKINLNTANIDSYSTKEILTAINEEDQKVALAVKLEIPNIAIAVDKISEAFLNGGRLFYVGAGTSGRLGILDASECPPTFGVEQDLVQGIIAGGPEAVFKAQEGAEDKKENGADEIIKRNIAPPDIVCGIAASGRTPFVIGALEEAKKRNIYTILVTTNSHKQIKAFNIPANIVIAPQVGAEVIAGSTRMKSGTAQKMVLNMLTSAAMIKIGKTYGNIMVDLQLTNKKLVERAKGIIMKTVGVDYSTAQNILLKSNGNVKYAIFMLKTGADIEIAKLFLKKNKGILVKAILNYEKTI